MKARPARSTFSIALCAVCVLLSGCAYDVARLAGDDTNGRDNGTPGSTLARTYLINALKPWAQGLNTAATGDARYVQPFSGGNNVVAVIPGTDLADQYVVVGAHYDHLGNHCRVPPGSTTDTICNGATDNATGVAEVLQIARSIATQPTKPRRSVVLALWDSEEDGLLGSLLLRAEPARAAGQDHGVRELRHPGRQPAAEPEEHELRGGPETGGTRLQSIVRSAIADQSLDTSLLSWVFGQGRSDYANFIARSVPTVFFTDANGPCYHTVDDEIGIVDFDKLDVQTAISLAVTRELASTSNPPAFVPGTPLATFDDAVELARAVNRAWIDRSRFSASDQATLGSIRDDFRRIVDDGRAAFDGGDVELPAQRRCDPGLVADGGRLRRVPLPLGRRARQGGGEPGGAARADARGSAQAQVGYGGRSARTGALAAAMRSPPARLRLLHCARGRGHQCATVGVRRLGVVRQADARGGPGDAGVRHLDHRGLDHSEQVARHGRRPLGVGLRQQHAELVASQARGHVALAQPFADRARHAADHLRRRPRGRARG